MRIANPCTVCLPQVPRNLLADPAVQGANLCLVVNDAEKRDPRAPKTMGYLSLTDENVHVLSVWSADLEIDPAHYASQSSCRRLAWFQQCERVQNPSLELCLVGPANANALRADPEA